MPLRLPLLWLLAVAEVIHAASVNPSSSTPVLQPARAPQPAEVPPSKQQPTGVLPTDQQQPIRGLSAEPSTVTNDTSSAKLERVAALAKSSIAGEKPADDDDPNNPDGAAYGDFLHIRHIFMLLAVIVVPLAVLLFLLFRPVLWGTTASASPSGPASSSATASKSGSIGGGGSASAAPKGIYPGSSSAFKGASSSLLDPTQHLALAFEHVALANPNKIAIRSMDGASVSVTYGTLLASARALASNLRQHACESSSSGGSSSSSSQGGGGRGDDVGSNSSGGSRGGGQMLVGLMIARSAEGAAGILGIVLAGGAYVPLDPQYPPQRLSQIIESARLRLAVTIAGSESERWLRTAWPSVRPVEAVLLRGVGADQPGPSSEEEMARLRVDDGANTRLAYVLFTSGSTGVPKGVAGYHHAVLSRVGYWHDAFPYEPEEESLHHITYTWVDHVMELWNALLGGRTLIVVPDVAALVACVDAPPPSVRRILLVPSLLRAMLDRGEAIGKVPSSFLSLVAVSGEPMPATLLGRYRSLIPNGTLVNVYGMTEGHGDCTAAVYPPSRPFDAATDRVAIGGPIIDFTLCVRDVDSGEWVREQGQQGELYLASSCVVPGYYAHADGVVIADEKAVTKFPRATPELGLNEASVPDGATLFQTGDLVAWRDDGELDHLGRVDDQVKVNGVRTELGDITAATLKCAGVDAALAVATKDINGETRVVVAVSPRLNHDELMAELATHLPPVYMPSSCLSLDDLPKLANGKVDRKALQALAAEQLSESGPTDSISRMFAGKGSGAILPGWHYLCLHLSFLAILFFLMAHVKIFRNYFYEDNLHYLPGTTTGRHSWVTWHGFGMDLFHAMSPAFFASGYVDLVAMPPRSWADFRKRWLTVFGIYVVASPCVGSANLWPVALLLIFRAVLWPLRLLFADIPEAPAWASVVVGGVIAFAGSAACLPWDLFKIDGAKHLPFESHITPLCGRSILEHIYTDGVSLPNFLQGFRTDSEQMIEENWGLSMLPAYALHPPLVAYLWPDAWKPAPPASAASTSADAGLFSRGRGLLTRLREPPCSRSCSRSRTWSPTTS